MNENNQAILLLTARFGPSTGDAVSPLGPAEYGRLASWLHKNGHEPRDLLRHPKELLADWSDSKDKVTVDRVKALLNRGMAMGVALEKWQGAGLWILTRADSEYPERLRKLLGQNAPATLFGAGSRALLNVGGLAMVGSRDITDADKEYTRQIARQAAQEGMNIVSGGARGVDEISMQSALEVEGTALGILSNGLLKTALSTKWRTFIKNRQLCLISSFSPEAGFDVGNAMGRNKYIYCLSDFALVVQSTKGKGGTWAGASENLKNHWVKLFVQDEGGSPGLKALLRMGARPLAFQHGRSATDEWLKEVLEKAEPSAPTDAAKPCEDLFYPLFVKEALHSLAKTAGISLAELKELFPDLCEKQIKDWLDRAVDDGHLERPGRQRVYQAKQVESTQQSLFDDD